MPLPRIAVTMGDPAGIGPEICLRLLANEQIVQECVPVVFGSAKILAWAADACNLCDPTCILSLPEWNEQHQQVTAPAVVDIPCVGESSVRPGHASAVTGHISFACIEAAIESALANQVAGVTTGPINKEALRDACILFPGHTEIFAEKTHATRFCMMQFSQEITCTFVTVHIGYREVPAHLTVERILDVIELTTDAMRTIHRREPKLLVCGLNPHAGENGLFGDREEETIIVPAIEAAREKGIQLEGPLPPDTAFVPERRNSCDAIICMYHDQGHIPVKALAFEKAVNVTLGLPIVRTSVDHGTALDIAWKGKASPSSLFEAVRLASRLAASREEAAAR